MSSTCVPWRRVVGCRFGAPVPKEAIDSWLEVTACRMDLPLGAVARALDLPIAMRPIWIRWLSLDQLDAIEATTGVSSSVVEAMTPAAVPPPGRAVRGVPQPGRRRP